LLALTVAKGAGRKSISYTAARRDRLDLNSSGDFQSLIKPSGFSRWWFSSCADESVGVANGDVSIADTICKGSRVTSVRSAG
jgi:hypothetical protein